jgi:hypothetical protein
VPEDHLTQAEVARRWRLSPRTLERWRSQGRGPQYLKLGGTVLYRAADIAAFEASRLHRPTSAAGRLPAPPMRLVPLKVRA